MRRIVNYLTIKTEGYSRKIAQNMEQKIRNKRYETYSRNSKQLLNMFNERNEMFDENNGTSLEFGDKEVKKSLLRKSDAPTVAFQLPNCRVRML